MSEETPTQAAFLDSLERANRQLDDLVRIRIRGTKPEPKLSCSSCTNPGCCAQKLVTPFQEALPIARQLRADGRDTPAFRAQLRAEGDAMEATSRAGWFRADRKCLFLTADGRCSVYENRPFACRTYYVMTPAENCLPENQGTPVAFLDFSDELGMLMERSGWINRDVLGLRETRKRLFLAPLVRSVAIALEAWELEGRAATDHITRQKWPTDEDVAADWLDYEEPHAP